jgi:hypothetical protein
MEGGPKREILTHPCQQKHPIMQGIIMRKESAFVSILMLIQAFASSTDANRAYGCKELDHNPF